MSKTGQPFYESYGKSTSTNATSEQDGSSIREVLTEAADSETSFGFMPLENPSTKGTSVEVVEQIENIDTDIYDNGKPKRRMIRGKIARN